MRRDRDGVDEGALRAHYRAQAGLYSRDQTVLDGAMLFADPALRDPEWNHLGLIDVAREELPRLEAEARRRLEQRDRATVFALDPWTRPRTLRDDLAACGWPLAFRHRWAFYRRSQPPRCRASALCIERVESATQMASFVAVYDAVFDAGPPAPQEVPGTSQEVPGTSHEVPGTYRGEATAALWHSFEQGAPGLEVVHHLGRLDGRPVAIGTSIHVDSVEGGGHAAFYNLGVLPGFRRRGFGARLSAHRVERALEHGARTLFLQTEADVVARWQQSQGWEPAFVVEGRSAP